MLRKDQTVVDDLLKRNASWNLHEFLEAQHAIEMEAQELADGQEADKCKYDDGYISQALYSCHTCNEARNKESAGFCYGCMMTCHVSHDVYELYTKRAFRCDCGNSKYSDTDCNTCMLQPVKDSVNVDNTYNHNFSGRYCHCDKEYLSETDKMFQCRLCQDWYHDRCVAIVPYEDCDFICGSCMLLPGNQFLLSYALPSYRLHILDPAYSSTLHPSALQLGAPITNGEDVSDDYVMSNMYDAQLYHPAAFINATVLPSTSITSVTTSSDCQRPFISVAVLHAIENGHFTRNDKRLDLLMPQDWLQTICRCVNCMQMYKTGKLEYLMNPDENDNNDVNDSYDLDNSIDSDVQVTPAISTMPNGDVHNGSGSGNSNNTVTLTAKTLRDEYSHEQLGLRTISQLPRDLTLDIIPKFRKFQDAVVAGIEKATKELMANRVGDGHITITNDKMKEIIADAKRIASPKKHGREYNEDSDDAGNKKQRYNPFK